MSDEEENDEEEGAQQKRDLKIRGLDRTRQTPRGSETAGTHIHRIIPFSPVFTKLRWVLISVGRRRFHLMFLYS
jgi:hypothetical protein